LIDIRAVVEIVTILLGAGIAWGTFTKTIESLRETNNNFKEDNQEQWVAITKIRDWVTVHERDEATARLDLERDMGRIRESVGKTDGKMDTLISMIVDLSKKLDKLEERLESK
jgi:hypothetical protein